MELCLNFNKLPENINDFLGKQVMVELRTGERIVGNLTKIYDDEIEISFPFGDLFKEFIAMKDEVVSFTVYGEFDCIHSEIDMTEEIKTEKMGMSPDRFKELLDELDGNSLQTLKEKNARYAQNGDCLHNFRSGADIAGGTPAQACWGYLTKHLVALRDKVERNDFSNREDFLEKCQDTINYIRFLWCIGNDERETDDK